MSRAASIPCETARFAMAAAGIFAAASREDTEPQVCGCMGAKSAPVHASSDASPRISAAGGRNLRCCIAGVRSTASSWMHGRGKCAPAHRASCTPASFSQPRQESPPLHGEGVQCRKSGDTRARKVRSCTPQPIHTRKFPPAEVCTGAESALVYALSPYRAASFSYLRQESPLLHSGGIQSCKFVDARAWKMRRCMRQPIHTRKFPPAAAGISAAAW